MFLKVRNDLIVNTDRIIAIDTDERKIQFDAPIKYGMDASYFVDMSGESNAELWRHLLRELNSLNVKERP